MLTDFEKFHPPQKNPPSTFIREMRQGPSLDESTVFVFISLFLLSNLKYILNKCFETKHELMIYPLEPKNQIHKTKY